MDFLYGFIHLSFWGYAAITFVLVQLMFLGVTLYLHRDQAHGGVELHPALRHFFRFWLWLIRPVFRELTETDGVARTFRSKLLVRHPSLLDERGHQQLGELLARHDVLRVVVDFRERLQQIWDNALTCRERASGQLRELCAEAERSDVRALKDFAWRLRAYAPAGDPQLRV